MLEIKLFEDEEGVTMKDLVLELFEVKGPEEVEMTDPVLDLFVRGEEVFSVLLIFFKMSSELLFSVLVLTFLE